MMPPAGRHLWLVKRRYMGQDLVTSPYGRYAEIPRRLAKSAETLILCLDYQGGAFERREDPSGLVIESYPLRALHKLLTRARAWAREQPDTVIIGGSDSPYAILASLVSTLSGAPYVLDYYDDYRTFASARLPLMPTLAHRAARRARSLVAFDARLATALGPDLGRAFSVVPNGIDTTRFRPGDRRAARAALGLPEEARIIGYVGAIMSDRNMSDIFESVRRLRADDPNVLLVLAGPHDARVTLPGDGMRYLGTLPHDQVPDLIAAADVLTATVRLDGSAGISFPVKVMEYIACKRPFVTPAEGGALDYLPDFPDYLYDVGHPETLTRQLAQLLARDDHAFPDVITWDDAAAGFAATLDAPVEKGGAPCPA